MKKIQLFFFLLIAFTIHAQNNIGIGTNTPNPNAKLDISSTTKGLLIPRMSSTQRITLAGTLGMSDEGMIVYDTDLQKFFYWDKNIGFSGNWNQLRPGSLSDGKIWIGDATNTAVEQSLSGDITLSNTGVTTIEVNAVQGTDISLTGESNGYVMQFNGTDWIPVDPTSLSVSNIYTANGSITGNRTVTMAANNLNFNSTNGNFIYNTSGTGKMGIGGTPSTYKLELFNSDALLNSVRVGLGAGNISTNTAVGSDALNSNTSGGSNVANGFQTLYLNSNGSGNVATGYSALYSNSTGSYNIANGYEALYTNSSGDDNVAIGGFTLNSNSIGSRNLAIGTRSLYINNTGNNNTAYGAYSLTGNTTGNNNVAIGDSTLYKNSTTNNNTAIGSAALRYNTSGFQNVALGSGSGTINTTGSNNTYLGYNSNSGLGLTGLSNATAIGANAIVGQSNAIVLGNNANVGIGTSTPNTSANLDVTASDKGMLIPRVSLTASNLAGPITTPAISLLVYNTATAGTFPNNVTPGYYYWDGTKWIKFMVNNSNTTDLGYIVAWTSNITPPDYLLPLNGGTFNWSDFPDFQTFNTSYPCQFIASSTGTTFTLVNINTTGRFLRGGTTTGVNQAYSTALPTTAFTTNTTGAHLHSVDPPSTTSSTNGAHSHNIGLRSNDGGWAATFPNAFHYNMSSGGGATSTSDRGATTNANTGIILSSGDHTHTTDITAFNSASNGDHSHSISSGGDAETRPINTSVIWCIKVKPTATSGTLTINNTANLATNGLSVYGGPVGLGGTLNQNTTVTQNANTLAFNSTATNGFSVDGATFSVDAANNRIGIGTITPTDRMDILPTGGKNILIGGGATTGSELKLTNTGSAHFSIYNSGNSKITFANTSSLFNTNVTGNPLLTIDNFGIVDVLSLAGTGNRPVFADASGNLTTPQLPKSTQVWNQNSNLPAINTNAFTTTAGSKITIFASGSGYRATTGIIGMDIYVDGSFRGSCKVFTNEVNSHKAFTSNAIVVTGLAAGTHSMQLVLRTGADATTSDLNDFFSATVIETPY